MQLLKRLDLAPRAVEAFVRLQGIGECFGAIGLDTVFCIGAREEERREEPYNKNKTASNGVGRPTTSVCKAENIFIGRNAKTEIIGKNSGREGARHHLKGPASAMLGCGTKSYRGSFVALERRRELWRHRPRSCFLHRGTGGGESRR